jgi:hypothetical protein
MPKGVPEMSRFSKVIAIFFDGRIHYLIAAKYN